MNKLCSCGCGERCRLETHRYIIGHNNRGIKFSDDHKNKLSSSHKGKTLSEETKKKISLAFTGRIKSKDHIENLRKAGIKYYKTKKGKLNAFNKSLNLSGEGNPMFGKKLTEEHKEKIRISSSGEKGNNWKGGSYEWLHKQARKLFGKDHCEICNIHIDEYSKKIKRINNFSMHCINKDHKNLTKDNWKTLCSSCHAKLHHLGNKKYKF